MKKLIIWFLSITSIINFSCYAYYEIPTKEDLTPYDSNAIDRIRLKNMTEIQIDREDFIVFNLRNRLITIINSDTVANTIHLSDVDKFMRAEYCLTKTIIFHFWFVSCNLWYFLIDNVWLHPWWLVNYLAE